MPKKLLSLYLRAGMATARTAINLTGKATRIASGVAGAAFRAAAGSDSSAPSPPSPRQEPARRESAPRDRPAARSDRAPEPAGGGPEARAPQRSPEPQPEVDYDSAPPTPLTHEEEVAKTIDDEPELVAEFAEPGAEDGAGPTLQIDPPWDGYDAMRAEDVTSRIDSATPEELAVLELYEAANKQRRSVLEAARRRHRELAGSAADR